jgi:hypothetical protein
MKSFLDWKYWSAQSHIKQLIESKGIEVARQQFIRESNKALWDDPIILVEHSAPGLSVSNNNSAGAGSTPSIIGFSSQIDRFTWASGITNNITGSHPLSASIHGNYVDITTYDGTVDYSYNHVNSSKTFRLYITSASNFTATNVNGIDGVITASYGFGTETTNVTGSILFKWADALANQTATAVVAGFTNTIAPSTLFTLTLAAGSGSLTVTHVNEGGVPGMSTTLTSATASVAVITAGTDRYYNNTNYYDGATLFNGSQSPYTTLTRRG